MSDEPARVIMEDLDDDVPVTPGFRYCARLGCGVQVRATRGRGARCLAHGPSPKQRRPLRVVVPDITTIFAELHRKGVFI